MICEFEFKKAIHDELGDDWFSDSDVAHVSNNFNIAIPQVWDDGKLISAVKDFLGHHALRHMPFAAICHPNAHSAFKIDYYIVQLW